ncbi:MAG TPA: VOC family protein [Thermoplasmata archaeon]|nr:VOC family protein [Thermoplasmata archaeon]
MLAIADVAVMVRSARESARWWEEKVGFEVSTIGPPGGHAVMIAPPGDRFVVHLCEGFAPLEPGNTGIAFVTDEIEALVGRMQAGGVTFTEPLRREGWGGTAKFADPDGNVFWLIGAPTKFIREQSARRAGAPPVRRSTSRRHEPTAGRRTRPRSQPRGTRSR